MKKDKSTLALSYFDLVIWSIWYCLVTYFWERLQSNIQKSKSELLIKSAKLMDERSIKYLIWLGADTDSKDTNGGHTFLHVFCMHAVMGKKAIKLIELMELLIKNGADVNSQNKHKETPLHYLCWQNTNKEMIEVIKFLIEKGADVNSQDKYGRTPLHYLCYKKIRIKKR